MAELYGAWQRYYDTYCFDEEAREMFLRALNKGAARAQLILNQ